MEYSAESVHYLHLAYALFLLVQVGYVAWLAVRWQRVQAEERALGSETGGERSRASRSR